MQLIWNVLHGNQIFPLWLLSCHFNYFTTNGFTNTYVEKVYERISHRMPKFHFLAVIHMTFERYVRGFYAHMCEGTFLLIRMPIVTPPLVSSVENGIQWLLHTSLSFIGEQGWKHSLVFYFFKRNFQLKFFVDSNRQDNMAEGCKNAENPIQCSPKGCTFHQVVVS